MTLQEWRQMDALTDDVVARFPDNRQVQRAAREREVHDMSELRVEAYGGKANGGGGSGAGAVSGSRDFGIQSTCTARRSMKTGGCSSAPVMPPATSPKAPAPTASSASAWSAVPAT
jgi:hypothetical protein